MEEEHPFHLSINVWKLIIFRCAFSEKGLATEKNGGNFRKKFSLEKEGQSKLLRYSP